MDTSWNNPWKLIAIGMALVVVTAVVTGIVVANRTGTKPAEQMTDTTAVVKPQATPAARAATSPRPTSSIPPQSAIDTCNKYAATPPSQRDKTIEVVKDVAIGGAGGAAVGAAGGAIAGGGKGAGKGAAIGGLVGAVGGTLYGLNDIHKNNQEAQAAYARCMQAHGHSG
jgi:predicted membrane-bound mannosyltransferase